MARELAAVVRRYRQDVPPVRVQEPYGGLRDPVRVLPVWEALHQQVVLAPLAEGDDSTLAALPDYQVHLPVAEASAVGLRGPLVDADPVRDVRGLRLAGDLLMAAILEPVAAVQTELAALVGPYPRIYAFVRYLNSFLVKISGDLSRRPVLIPQKSQRLPYHAVRQRPVPRQVTPAVLCPFVSCRPAVFAVAVAVALQLPADCGFVHSDLPSNGCLAPAFLFSQIYCISLLTGQLFIHIAIQR